MARLRHFDVTNSILGQQFAIESGQRIHHQRGDRFVLAAGEQPDTVIAEEFDRINLAGFGQLRNRF